MVLAELVSVTVPVPKALFWPTLITAAPEPKSVNPPENPELLPVKLTLPLMTVMLPGPEMAPEKVCPAPVGPAMNRSRSSARLPDMMPPPLPLMVIFAEAVPPARTMMSRATETGEARLKSNAAVPGASTSGPLPAPSGPGAP